MAIGCDVFIGGMKSFGPVTVYKEVVELREEDKESAYASLLNFIVHK